MAQVNPFIRESTNLFKSSISRDKDVQYSHTILNVLNTLQERTVMNAMYLPIECEHDLEHCNPALGTRGCVCDVNKSSGALRPTEC